MSRSIEEILDFREDISPFLVHLTKDAGEKTASEVLKKILAEKKLVPGGVPISDARFYFSAEGEKRDFCSAISFTETPLNEIHCLLDIVKRSVELRPYGLVFLKSRLRKSGVSPVLYLNNELNDKNEVLAALRDLARTKPEAGKKILPLIATFGKKLFADEEIDFFF